MRVEERAPGMSLKILAGSANLSLAENIARNVNVALVRRVLELFPMVNYILSSRRVCAATVSISSSRPVRLLMSICSSFVIQRIVGDVRDKQVLVVDDMISTGGTIEKASRLCSKRLLIFRDKDSCKPWFACRPRGGAARETAH